MSRRECRAGPACLIQVKTRLDRFPLQLNRKAVQPFMFGRIFFGKPVPTFPENAL